MTQNTISKILEEKIATHAHAIINADTEYDAQQMLKNVWISAREEGYQEGYRIGILKDKRPIDQIKQEAIEAYKSSPEFKKLLDERYQEGRKYSDGKSAQLSYVDGLKDGIKQAIDTFKAELREKIPRKSTPSDVIQLDVVSQATEKGKLHYQREYGRLEGRDAYREEILKLIQPSTPKCLRCNDNGCPACDTKNRGSKYNPEPY